MSDLNNLSLVHPEEFQEIHPEELLEEKKMETKNEVSLDSHFDEIIDVNDDRETYVSSSSELEVSQDSDEDDTINNIKEMTVLHNNYTNDEDSTLRKLEEIFEEKPKRVDRGNGIMDYIDEKHSREMLENAWKAINLTETWDFVAQDIESFMWSNDERIWVITRKMEELGYNGHSGFSFGWTMRNMQYLAQNGVEKFKEGFIKNRKPTRQVPVETAPQVPVETAPQVPVQRPNVNNSTTYTRAVPPPIGTTSTFGNMTLVYRGGF